MKIIFSLLAISTLMFAESIRGAVYDDMIKAANTKVELEKVYYTEKVATPKVEAPKVEAPKAEALKVEAPKAEVPKAEVPKAEAAVETTTVPKVETNASH